MILEVKLCEVGLFRLPGVVFDKEQMTAAKIAEMDEWAQSAQGVGKRMTDLLWSFKNASQRDWFLIRWSTDSE